MNRVLLLIVLLSKFMTNIGSCGHFDLVLLHSNNINFQFDETRDQMGGTGRALHVLNKFRKQAELGVGPPVLYLNAGDNFAMSRSYSSIQWEIVADFINTLKPDVICLGNHDFDMEPSNFTLFLQKVTPPIVGANFDFRFDKNLSDRIKPFHIFRIHNRTIGVVGYISTRYKFHSESGENLLRDEVKSVRRECLRLREMGVNIIIALGHGEYELDKAIAREVENVDVIVSGGYKGTWKTKEGSYRNVVRRRNGEKIPIVYEYGYMKYLGMLVIQFDRDGVVEKFHGQPIVLHKNIPQAREASAFLKRFKRETADLDEVLGTTRTSLSNQCIRSECNYGNLVCDAVCDVWTTMRVEKQYWTKFPMAAVDGEVIKGSIPIKGEVTRRDLTNTLKYDYTFIEVSIKGEFIMQAFEQALLRRDDNKKGLFQISGLHVTLNLSKSVGHRVTRLYVRCAECDVPTYEPMDMQTMYPMILDEYLYFGGNDVRVFYKRTKNGTRRSYRLGDIVATYIQNTKTLWPEQDDRLHLVGKCSKLSVLEPAIAVFFIYLLNIL